MSAVENRKIFVGNLNYRTSDVSFAQHFAKYGDIEDIVILRDKNGRSKRCGFVTFTEPSMAQEALSANTHIVDGQEVDVKTAIPKSSMHADKNRENLPKNFQKTIKHLNKLYVSNLGPNIKDEQLRRYFSKYGNVQDAYTAKDPNKKSKGFGFVIFQNQDSVEKVQKDRPHSISGKEITTMRGYPDDAPADDKKPTTTLFVMNYEDWVEVKDVEQHFSQFGVIEATTSRMNRRENTKYTVLEFEDYDVVDKIILTKKHTIKNCNLIVKKYLEEKPEEQKTESVKKVETSKDKPSRSSSVQRQNYKPPNKQQPAVQEKTQTAQNTASAPIAPCAPPFEDLRNPGINPAYHDNRQTPHQPLYPSIPNVSNINFNSHLRSTSAGPSYNHVLNRSPNQRNQNQREDRNNCVIS